MHSDGYELRTIVAVLFLFCYERDFMMSLSEEKQSEVIDDFSSTSRYLDDLIYIYNNYFDGFISQINPSQLQVNKANSFENIVLFWFAFVYFRWVCFMQNL